jgi:hypothetical protein
VREALVQEEIKIQEVMEIFIKLPLLKMEQVQYLVQLQV